MMVAHVLHALYVTLLGNIVIAHRYNEVEPRLYMCFERLTPRFRRNREAMLPLRHSLFHQEGEAAKPGLMKQTLEKKQKYFQLLQLEQYCDSHKTEVDKRIDLRKDLFVKLTEKVQKMQKEKKKDI